jgi:hypothetical protein
MKWIQRPKWLKWPSILGSQELAAAAGFGLFVRGVWMVYKPAAFLIAGAILMWISWIMSPPPRST